MTATAFDHADLVRRVAERDARPIASMKALADELSRDPSNLRKTIKALADDGVFTWQSGELPTLTDLGRQTLRGIDVAQGIASDMGDASTPTVWPADQIVPHPLNRTVQPEKVARRADSIAEHGIISPLVLTPVDPNGVRMLVDGEYRWRGHLLTIEQGRAHPSLAQGLPFVERAVSDEEAVAITIAANIEHESLSPWEEALQLAKIAAAAPELSGAEIARRTNKKAKDVQDKLRLVREATPEQIAEYEETRSWDAFRNVVFGRGATFEPGNAPLQMFLVEAALKSDTETGVWDGDLALDTGLLFPGSWGENEWFTYQPRSGHFRLTDKATTWLGRAGLGDDAEELLERVVVAAGYALPATPGHWRSPFLQPAPTQFASAPAVQAPTGPHVVNGIDYLNAARVGEARRAAGLEPRHSNSGGGSPRTADSAEPALPGTDIEPEATPLSPRARLAMVELAHKMGAHPRSLTTGDRPEAGEMVGAFVGRFWTDALFNELASGDRLIRAVGVPGGVPPMATLTDAGNAWLLNEGFEPPISDHVLREEQGRGGHPAAAGYVTDFLANEVAPAAAPAQVATEGQPELLDDPIDRWDRSADDITAAEDLLARVHVFTENADDGDTSLARDLMKELSVSGPFSEDGTGGLVGELGPDVTTLADFDVMRNDLPPQQSRAIALMAAWAMNVVFSSGASA